MAEEESANVTEEKKGGNNMMMIILIVLVVALLGAVGFLGYMMMNQQAEGTDGEVAAKELEKEEKEEAEAGETFTTAIDSLVLNITNAKGREKLMKLSFTLKSEEPTIATIVELNNAEIIDSVIAKVSARTSEELLTAGGKLLLKDEMLEEINAILNEATALNEDIKQNSIKKIFFTTFVIK